MVTIHRAFGFRFAIYLDDHDPPHVHVLGQGGEARIALSGTDGVSLLWSKGIGAGDLRRLRREAARERERLLYEWRRIHG